MQAELFGRAAEQSRARALLAAASRGQGAVLALTGEAGIGKTVLARQVAREASQAGFRVAWGHCWEAGGAPAFWPWTEIFHELGADDPFTTADSVAMYAHDSRFRQFEMARRALLQLARKTPLCLLIEDIHACDPASLSFLLLLARSAREHSILIVLTYREVEARQTEEISAAIAKLARQSETCSLGRLVAEEVEQWTQQAWPEASLDAAREIYSASEGHPLFVHEILKLRAKIDWHRPPQGVSSVLDDVLGRLSASTRELTNVVAVLGRRAELADIAAAARCDPITVEEGLREMCAAGVLEASSTHPESVSFTHILIRDRVYAELKVEAKKTYHQRHGERLFETGVDLAVAAHHLLEGATPKTAPRAAAVARDAAALAMRRLAFEDAVSLSQRALASLRIASEPTAVEALACELEILCAEGDIYAGETARGKDRCVAAAARARKMGRRDLEARAALVYSAEIVSGAVDPKMVELLRAALAGLEPGASFDGLRARVMARLAAALHPPSSYAGLLESQQMATGALELARGLSDPETLLFVSSFATLTAPYQASEDERYETIRTVIDLANELGQGVTWINAAPWWIANLRERGMNMQAALAAEAYVHRVGELPRPQSQWRPPMVRATLAMLDGDFSAAEALAEQSRAIAEEGSLPLGALGWAHCRIALAQLSGEPASIAVHAERMLLALMPLPACAGAVAWVLAATKRETEARERLRQLLQENETPEHAALLKDWFLAGDAVTLLADRELAERVLPIIEAAARLMKVSWGLPRCAGVFGPATRILGDLCLLLEKTDTAARHYQQALATVERLGAVSLAANLRRRLEQLSRPQPTKAVSRPSSAPHATVRFAREGDIWLITSFTGIQVRLKDARGVRYLDQLVSHPGQDVHVVDLLGEEARTGDAGPMLDRAAKHAYERRLRDLRDELEEAKRLSDLGRMERAQDEIEAITAQLRSAYGLAGRERRAGSHSERARVNVQRRIRVTLGRIEQQDSELARYLSATIRTGTFCCYEPVR